MSGRTTNADFGEGLTSPPPQAEWVRHKARLNTVHLLDARGTVAEDIVETLDMLGLLPEEGIEP